MVISRQWLGVSVQYTQLFALSYSRKGEAIIQSKTIVIAHEKFISQFLLHTNSQLSNLNS